MPVKNQTELHCDDCGEHFADVVDGHSGEPLNDHPAWLLCRSCSPQGKFEIVGHDFTRYCA